MTEVGVVTMSSALAVCTVPDTNKNANYDVRILFSLNTHTNLPTPCDSQGRLYFGVLVVVQLMVIYDTTFCAVAPGQRNSLLTQHNPMHVY